MSVITISNQKGGVGKTTTASAFAAGLKYLYPELRILAIDLDASMNLSAYMGAWEFKPSILDVFLKDIEIKDAIIQRQGIDFLPASANLARAEMLFSEAERPYILKSVIEPIRDDYDYIIIDTPPNLGAMMLMAFTASDKIIIPMSLDSFAMRGVSALKQTIDLAKKHLNSDLEIDGILLTKRKVTTRRDKNISKAMTEVSKFLDAKIYESSIRDSVVVGDAQMETKTIYEFSINHDATKDYIRFIQEFIEGGKTDEQE